MNKVYIIIVNWNGWKDTIECLESIFRNNYPHYQVLVCDNNSLDGSLERIKSWAEGGIQADVSEYHPLKRLSYPPVIKPIRYIEYARSQAEAGGYEQASEAPLILIQTNSNLGFAGGNNVGLRYALARDDFSCAWLLNNDTVIEPDALSELVNRMQERPDAGMCGSTIPYYNDPKVIWALGGGTYNKWIARSYNIGYLQSLSGSIDLKSIEGRLDYIAGASVLVSRSFLKEIGLMNEAYFLFFEEPDWAFRAKRRYFLAYAPTSVVYHKVGASTTIFDNLSKVYNSSLYYTLRNHLFFTYKFFPLALPIVFCRIIYLILKQLWHKYIIIRENG